VGTIVVGTKVVESTAWLSVVTAWLSVFVVVVVVTLAAGLAGACIFPAMPTNALLVLMLVSLALFDAVVAMTILVYMPND